MTEGFIAGRSLATGHSSGLEEGYAELMAAIIRQAVKDYETVLIKLFHKPSGIKKVRLETERVELEVFFHSPWYELLTEIDGDRLIEATRRHAVEKEKAAIRRRQKKKLKEMEKAALTECLVFAEDSMHSGRSVCVADE